MGIQSRQQKKKYDAIIVGGGMVGLALSIALAKSDVRVAIIDRDDLHSQLLPAFDGRVSAISHGSERVMRAIGVWQYMQERAQPIYDIRVADADRLPMCIITTVKLASNQWDIWWRTGISEWHC